MIRVAVALLVLLTASVCASSQVSSDTKEPARFEVVSIRPVPPDSMGDLTEPVGTEFRAHAIPLSELVQMAFGLNPNQIVVPEWAHGTKFDIAAKTGSSVSLTYEQMKPLLQRMLTDRFAMTSHPETREVQGYDMVAAKGGLKLISARPESSKGGGAGPGAIDLPSTTMRGLAAMLTLKLEHPVADKTGATGNFEVKLRFATDDDVNPTLPLITTVLQEQLGLKLTSAKVPVKMVVIDHLDKVPTDN